jgi:hypothetical protein
MISTGDPQRRQHRASFVSLSSSSPDSQGEREEIKEDDDDDDDDVMSMDKINLRAFQSELAKRQPTDETTTTMTTTTIDDFDGYMFRNVLYEKWGACWDVEFQKFDTFGNRKLYLNVLPFQLGRRPFRHATEYDYLCHLQAVVEILIKYQQVRYVIYVLCVVVVVGMCLVFYGRQWFNLWCCMAIDKKVPYHFSLFSSWTTFCIKFKKRTKSLGQERVHWWQCRCDWIFPQSKSIASWDILPVLCSTT